MDEILDCDKEIDNLLEIYHRAAMEESAFSIDSSTQPPIKDSYDAVLAT